MMNQVLRSHNDFNQLRGGGKYEINQFTNMTQSTLTKRGSILIQSARCNSVITIPNTSTGLIDFTPSPSGEGLFLGVIT